MRVFRNASGSAIESAILSLFTAALLGGTFVWLVSAQTTSPAPQYMVLKTTEVDVSREPTPRKHHGPLNIQRHFANPALLGRAKAALAASENSSPQTERNPIPSKHQPPPSPTATPTPTPSPTPTPVAGSLPISSHVTNPVAITTHFDAMGLFDGGGYVPPDTTVAGGATFVVEAVNVLGAVYNTAGSLLANLNTAACTTNSSVDSVSDPKVLFDVASSRWYISTTTFSPIGDASWNLLFSPSNDPTASTWHCLIISTSKIRNPDGSTGNFPDFPKIGMNSDKVVLTGDAFSQVGRTYKFQGTEFVVINKSALLSGTVNLASFPPDQGDFAIEPAQQLDSTTETLYMAAVNSTLTSTSTIDVWAISGVPGGALLQTKVTSLPIYTISVPPNAEQPGNTGVLIETNDESLLDASYRDGSAGAPGSLWVSANDACNPPGDNTVRSCSRFINVSIGAGMSVAQDFDYADLGTYYYYPATRTDKSGNLYATFSGSSSTTYASAYAGLQSFGSTNMLTKLSVMRAGDYPYTVSPPRWGDYSGVGVDPDDASAWLGAEYATSFSIFGSVWGTAIAHAGP